MVNTDLSLFRNFPITERLNLQFRAEAYNLSNTPHFANPNGNRNSSNFGKITATQTVDALGRLPRPSLRLTTCLLVRGRQLPRCEPGFGPVWGSQ